MAIGNDCLTPRVFVNLTSVRSAVPIARSVRTTCTPWTVIGPWSGTHRPDSRCRRRPRTASHRRSGRDLRRTHRSMHRCRRRQPPRTRLSRNRGTHPTCCLAPRCWRWIHPEQPCRSACHGCRVGYLHHQQRRDGHWDEREQLAYPQGKTPSSYSWLSRGAYGSDRRLTRAPDLLARRPEPARLRTDATPLTRRGTVRALADLAPSIGCHLMADFLDGLRAGGRRRGVPGGRRAHRPRAARSRRGAPRSVRRRLPLGRLARGPLVRPGARDRRANASSRSTSR